MSKEKKPRNKKIHDLKKIAGWSYSRITKETGLSQHRIQVIVADYERKYVKSVVKN